MGRFCHARMLLSGIQGGDWRLALTGLLDPCQKHAGMTGNRASSSLSESKTQSWPGSAMGLKLPCLVQSERSTEVVGFAL
jgi:hypothetical protein